LERAERIVGVADEATYVFLDLDTAGRPVRAWLSGPAWGWKWHEVPPDDVPETVVVAKAVRSPCSFADLCGGRIFGSRRADDGEEV
jgi:hypothetical protein